MTLLTWKLVASSALYHWHRLWCFVLDELANLYFVYFLNRSSFTCHCLIITQITELPFYARLKTYTTILVHFCHIRKLTGGNKLHFWGTFMQNGTTKRMESKQSKRNVWNEKLSLTIPWQDFLVFFNFSNSETRLLLYFYFNTRFVWRVRWFLDQLRRKDRLLAFSASFV